VNRKPIYFTVKFKNSLTNCLIISTIFIKTFVEVYLLLATVPPVPLCMHIGASEVQLWSLRSKVHDSYRSPPVVGVCRGVLAVNPSLVCFDPWPLKVLRKVFVIFLCCFFLCTILHKCQQSSQSLNSANDVWKNLPREFLSAVKA